MTNEEEKILDEILEEENDITLEEAAEEAEDLQEEMQDEGRAIEIPIERREDANLEEIPERQVLRDGLRDANPNMIQTHMDNFLAKIVGETPVDDKPRNSTEFWLNEIAENLPGGGTEVIANPTLAGTEDALTGLQVGDTKYSVGKLYRHTIRDNSIGAKCEIITRDATPFTRQTLAQFLYNLERRNYNNAIPLAYYYKDDSYIDFCAGLYASTNASVSVAYIRVSITTPFAITNIILDSSSVQNIADTVTEV